MSKKLFLVLALIPVLLFAGCGKKKDAQPSPAEEALDADGATAENPYHVPDLMTAFDWCGHPVSRLGIHHSYVGETGVRIYGELFACPADGKAFFDAEAKEENTIGSVALYLNEDALPSEKCMEQLEELYESPFDEGEEPYDAANGGAVRWMVYDTGSGELRYSRGSENDWYSLTYTPKEEELPPYMIPVTGDYIIPDPGWGFISWDADGDLTDDGLGFTFQDLGDEAPGYMEFSLYIGSDVLQATLDRAYGLTGICSKADEEGPYLEITYYMGDHYSHSTESTCTLRLRDGALVLEGDNV